jgi:hypothetical protein
VPADIFAQTEQPPFGREERSGMESSRALKDLLGLTKQIG